MFGFLATLVVFLYFCDYSRQRFDERRVHTFKKNIVELQQQVLILQDERQIACNQGKRLVSRNEELVELIREHDPAFDIPKDNVDIIFGCCEKLDSSEEGESDE